MKYYHGTDMESGLNIIKSGKFGADATVWNCTSNTTTYVVSEEYDDDPDCAIRFAVEAGQIAAADKDSKSVNIMIFEFESSPDNFLPDCSCENMYDCYEIENDDLNKLIENGEIKMRVLIAEDAYEPYMRIFYLKNLVSNSYYDFADKRLEEVCKNIEKWDSIFFIDEFLGVYSNLTEYDLFESEF